MDGAGGLRASGRWHRKGLPIVYMANSSALAILEILVHLEVTIVPAPFQLLEIDIPDHVPVDTCLGLVSMEESSAIGSQWLLGGRNGLLIVSSAIAPRSYNLLLNPMHPDAREVTIVDQSRWPWDRRLF